MTAFKGDSLEEPGDELAALVRAEVASQERVQAPASPAPARVVSIDALRGFDMFWIVGGRYVVLGIVALFVSPLPEWFKYQMDHPDWIGFSAWDMIMPLFLFIVGAAMPFSFARRAEQGQSTAQIHRKILFRTVTLFVFGMAAQGHLLDFDLSTLHVFCNTLQAIAVGYLVSALLLVHTRLGWQIGITAALLLAFWALLSLVPPPGQAAVNLEQPEQNIAAYVDKAILGQFDDGTTYTWILSSLGFAGTVMLGVFAGKLLRTGLCHWSKVGLLVLIGLACLGAGWLWSRHLPIIKHIWTSSMVLWAAGWSYLLLALFYLLIDAIGLRFWAFPFVVLGMNAIFVYMVNSVLGFRRFSDPIVGGLARNVGEWFGEPYKEALLAVAAFAVAWLILLYMYRKKTFLRV